MKKIEAMLQPEKVEDVRMSLEKIGYGGITILEAKGNGRQKGVFKQFRGEKYKIPLLPKTKIEIIVNDSDVDKIVKTLVAAARTGEIGDGKIFISSIESAIKIRTGEQGESVI